MIKKTTAWDRDEMVIKEVAFVAVPYEHDGGWVLELTQKGRVVDMKPKKKPGFSRAISHHYAASHVSTQVSNRLFLCF